MLNVLSNQKLISPRFFTFWSPHASFSSLKNLVILKKMYIFRLLVVCPRSLSFSRRSETLSRNENNRTVPYQIDEEAAPLPQQPRGRQALPSERSTNGVVAGLSTPGMASALLLAALFDFSPARAHLNDRNPIGGLSAGSCGRTRFLVRDRSSFIYRRIFGSCVSLRVMCRQQLW